jgi:hypothetical protein
MASPVCTPEHLSPDLSPSLLFDASLCPDLNAELARNDFEAVVNFPMAFKTVVNSAGEVCSELQMSVVLNGCMNNPEFRGICVEALNHYCMVLAYVSCDVSAVDVPGQRRRFFVDASTLHTCLRGVSAGQKLIIARTADSNDVSFRCEDVQSPESFGTCSEFVLGTLNKEGDNRRLDQMEFDYVVEAEMSLLRSIVKTARDLKATELRFQVHEASNGPVLVVGCEGHARVRHTFNGVVLNSGAGYAPSDTTFDKCFLVEYLYTFIKSADRTTVTMRLGAGVPMVLSYHLGDMQSSLSFILVPA